MENKRLVGADGKLLTGIFGADLIVGEVLVAGTWYKVIGVENAGSALPLGVAEGYLFKATGGEELVGADIVQEFESVSMCDIQTWSLEFSKAEIEVTTMCDSQKAYRTGKTDVTGSIEGVMTMDITDGTNGFLNQFVTIVHQDAGTYTIEVAEDGEMYVMLYVDSTDVVGEKEAFYFCPVSVNGFSASAGGEDAQTFSSPFRVAPSDQGVVFYEYENV